jgi:hypothetical protein
MTELSVGICESCHREAPLVDSLCAACRPVDAPVIDPRSLPGDEARLLYLTARHNANERHPPVAMPGGMRPSRYNSIVGRWLACGWACRCNLLPVLTITGRLAARQLTQVDLHQKGACLPGCELCPRPGRGG